MFSRVANLIRGFFSLFISGVEKRNPEALLELEQENLRKQIGNFNQGLATHAGLCERIMGQVRKLETEQKDLRAKIESMKGAINDMRMNQAMAEIHEMASGMISSIGGSGDTLNRLEAMVEEERTKAAGRARVARDSIDMSQVDIKESEMNALADQALADFAAREGISIPADAAPAPAPRSMGEGQSS